MHGRGGQGVVTASYLLAWAAFLEGKYVQAFPMFGVERRGAPVEAYVRLDEKPIELRSQIYEPDFVLVLDPTLLGVLDVGRGVKEGGCVIINRKEEWKERVKGKFRVKTVDLYKIAEEVLGRPVVNTTMLGAFAALTGVVSLNSLREAVRRRFKGRMVELNLQLVEKAFQTVKNEVQLRSSHH